MSKLIIVCGLPASGKTTLANALSSKLNIVCLHKDSIKESLYDTFHFTKVEDSRKLGIHSINLLFNLTEEQLKNNVDLIIEAPFYFEKDYDIFRSWQEKYKIDLYSIVCQTSQKLRDQRFNTRLRHDAHKDIDKLILHGQHDTPANDDVYKNLPGKLIYVNTDEKLETLIPNLSPLLF